MAHPMLSHAPSVNAICEITKWIKIKDNSKLHVFIGISFTLANKKNISTERPKLYS
jgi:hypothetical protein